MLIHYNNCTSDNMDLEKYKALSPTEKIEMKIAQHNIFSVEINAIISRRGSKISELENKLAKERHDALQQEVWICDNDVYKIFYEELPADVPNRTEILEKIEVANVALWVYDQGMPIGINKSGEDEYKALSPHNKVEWKIAEQNILDIEIKAIGKRRRSKKISEIEKKLLQEREREVVRSMCACFEEIWRVSWNELPMDAPNREELDGRIKAANITKSRYDSLQRANTS